VLAPVRLDAGAETVAAFERQIDDSTLMNSSAAVGLVERYVHGEVEGPK
jgi:hypothetical protein